MQTSQNAVPVSLVATAELKVNLHIVEVCNMHCEFCFAKFQCMKALTLEEWKHIVDNIADGNNEGGIQL